MKIVKIVIICLILSNLLIINTFSAGGKGNVKDLGKQVYTWSFNEGSGKETKDSNVGLVGKFVGDIKWVKGASQTAGDFALQFSGKVASAQYVEIAHSTEIDIDEQITMSAWVYPDHLPTGGQENKFTIIFKLTYYMQLEPNDGKTSPIAYYFYEAQPEQYYLSEATIKPKEWSHVALSWDGTKATFYVNGKKSNSANHKGPGKSNTNAIQIGGENAACCPRFFQGIIDNVTIANYALDDNKIRELVTSLAVDRQNKLATTWGVMKH